LRRVPDRRAGSGVKWILEGGKEGNMRKFGVSDIIWLLTTAAVILIAIALFG